MDEHEVTRLFAQAKISLSEYRNLLRQIAAARHHRAIEKMGDRRSMSSSKWC